MFLQQWGIVPAAFIPATLFSSMFLHGSWSHVIGNMWYLWIFGDNVEDRVGHGRFVAFYLLCGLVAAFGQMALDPDSTVPMIGASGAIAGVMGGYIVLYPQSRVLTLIPLIIIWEIIELPAVVLLGSGSYRYRDWDDGQVTSVDDIGHSRVLEAARVFRLANADYLISSGGLLEARDRHVASGSAMADVLVRLGVPRARVRVEDESGTTHDGAVGG